MRGRADIIASSYLACSQLRGRCVSVTACCQWGMTVHSQHVVMHCFFPGPSWQMLSKTAGSAARTELGSELVESGVFDTPLIGWGIHVVNQRGLGTQLIVSFKTHSPTGCMLGIMLCFTRKLCWTQSFAFHFVCDLSSVCFFSLAGFQEISEEMTFSAAAALKRLMMEAL